MIRIQFESLQNQGKRKNLLYNPLITGLLLAEPPIASFVLNAVHSELFRIVKYNILVLH